MTSAQENPETKNNETTQERKGRGGRGSLQPKDSVTKDAAQAFRRGFLVAKREGFSFATNSIGPLWIMEIDDPGAQDNGRLVRCFDRIPDNIMMGNSADDVPPLWFQVTRMLRPDGARIEVAVNVTTDEPAPANA
ncbi:MAG: hypothetical protein AAGM67_11525 [Bacteroidota bacterium]